jgi:hypothetical protein
LNLTHFCRKLRRAAAAAEGELIRHKAAEEAAELAAKEAAWRAKAKEMNAATKASNDTLLAFKAAERQRDKQLEAAVEGEAAMDAGGACAGGVMDAVVMYAPACLL